YNRACGSIACGLRFERLTLLRYKGRAALREFPIDRTTNATIRKPITILYSVGISTNEDNSHLTAEILAQNQASASKKGASKTKLTAGSGVTESGIAESVILVRCMIPLDIHVGDILAQPNW
ncbi:hypothetical protein, partial [Microcoleus sp. Pol10D4]|uniref:hypothetical protein n=1 Tax=Microcoleus sp. Pol10D4 TaxID=3055387 RepID=UPI002FCFDA1D